VDIRQAVAISLEKGKVVTQNCIGGYLGQKTTGKFKTKEEAKAYYEKAGFTVYA